MIKSVLELVKLPAGKLVVALLMIAVAVLFRQQTKDKENIDKQVEKREDRHEIVVSIKDSLLRESNRSCDAKLAMKDAEISRITDKHAALLEKLLQQTMEANKSVKKAEKDVDKAIHTKTNQ